MIEVWLLPLSALMAGIALIAAVSFMRIVFQVARNACAVLSILERVFRMALAASQGRVFSLEQEVRIASVIEAGVVPVGRVVAILAVLTA